MPLTLEVVAYRLLPRVAPGRALAEREWLTLVHVIEALLDGEEVGVSPERAADNVEGFLIAGRSRRAWRVRVLLELIEATSLATHRRVFSKLSLAERREIIERKWVGGHGIFRICSKVKNLALVGVYGDRQAGAATGYVPVPQRPRFKDVRPASAAN